MTVWEKVLITYAVGVIVILGGPAAFALWRSPHSKALIEREDGVVH